MNTPFEIERGLLSNLIYRTGAGIPHPGSVFEYFGGGGRVAPKDYGGRVGGI